MRPTSHGCHAVSSHVIMRGAVLLAVTLSGCDERAPSGSPAAESPLAAPSASTSAPSAPSASSAPIATVDAHSTPDAQPPALDAAPSAARVYIRAHSLPIHADATLKGDWIGMLAAGDSVRLRNVQSGIAHGCASVIAIEPRGWICLDGDGATLDKNDPAYIALRSHLPDPGAALPYSYGESPAGTRRQKTFPGMQGPPWPPVVFDPRAAVAPRSTVAWTGEVQGEGGPWLRMNDMSFVPKDKVVPFERSDFHGVALGGDVKLPLAFFKNAPHTKYKRDAKGRLSPTSDTWPRLGWVALTGQNEKRGGRTFWETHEEGIWIDARSAAIVAPEADGAQAPVPHGTWIEVAALQGWLVAWEGDHAVYATMVSAGKLGAVKAELDHPSHQPPATTPMGTFHIKEKLVTATLQSDLDDGTDFIHAEVPWSQRFYDKYLLHTAYWHDRWGEGHSGGCVNLAPIDAKWLFGWSEPRVPEGWHAVRATEAGADVGSLVVIHP